MINRVLIRIKVVQMLYSYLLTKSEFKISGTPDKQTRDNLYAYRVYIDLLLILLKLSGYKLSPSDTALALSDNKGKNPLGKSVVAASLSQISDIRDFGVKYASRISGLNSAIKDLFETVIGQSIVIDTMKKRKLSIADEVVMWSTILNDVIIKDRNLIEALRNDDDFTNVGFERGIKMLVDTLQSYSDTRTTLISAKKGLESSLDQGYLLYNALMWLPVQLTRMQYDNLELAKDKYLPTAQDLNPNTRFVENAFVAALRESTQLEDYFKANPFSWDSDYYMLRKLLDSILASEAYKRYMEMDKTDFAKDAELWRELFKTVILTSDHLVEALESRSVLWNDDLTTVGTFVMKTIRRAATDPDHKVKLLPEFKDEEDAQFGIKLFTYTVDGFKSYRELIDKFIDTTNWDPERIAFMDTIIVATALAEIINFEKIPLVVSINEYIEIANYYSTPRSGQFVNGILYTICNYLKEQGTLHKTFDTPGK